MPDLTKQMYLNSAGSLDQSATLEADWFLTLLEGGESAISEAAAQFLKRLQVFQSDFANGGYIGSLYNPPRELNRWRQGLFQDLTKFTEAVTGQLFEIVPSLRILDVKLKYDMYDLILNVFCKLMGVIGTIISSEDVLALACEDAERQLVELSGEYSTYNSDFFTEMDWYLTKLSEMTQNPALQTRFLKLGNDFVGWGARLVKELAE